MKPFALLTIVVAMFLAACGPAAAPATGTPGAGAADTPVATPPATAPAGGSLEGTRWTLVSFGPKGAEIPAVAGSTVTLEFLEPGRLGGNGGCNGYGAEYQVEGNTLAVGSIASTMMACADDNITRQESAYFQALQMAGAYEMAGDRLIITYDNGAGVLTYSRQA